jgi:hypothetical protein
MVVVLTRFPPLVPGYAGCAPHGIWVFRSKIFGGLSAEVTTIFNGSSIVDISKRRPLFIATLTLIFSLFFFAGFELIPKEGFPEGKEIFLGDSAYTRAALAAGVQVRTPVPLPVDGSLPKVCQWTCFF